MTKYQEFIGIGSTDITRTYSLPPGENPIADYYYYYYYVSVGLIILNSKINLDIGELFYFVLSRRSCYRVNVILLFFSLICL
jgi:hypothetical protein